MSSSSSTAGGNMFSRNSTPATDFTAIDSDDFVLPPPSEETLRRRAQSDRASAEIGSRMLKGWAMLSEECPNDECWAIPLVRFPRSRPGAEPDPRMECVICNTVYVNDGNGQLVAQRATPSRTTAAPPQPNSARGTSTPTPQPIARSGTVITPAVAQPSTTEQTPVTQSLPKSATLLFGPAENALAGALAALSQKMAHVSLETDINTKQVKDTAEAMKVVMRALEVARNLRKGD
ncbi:unnamed protein product [Rhizoctonia solani]|uniref:Uncharacterized protein n=1 Tax=Rhizoctonia solani TaxID=456999 RepID=A0A8H2XZA0_9AGAM|nr:unnamed protein product [Rhizoctonia solani]